MCQVSVKQTPLTEASDMKPSYTSGEGIGLCGEKVEMLRVRDEGDSMRQGGE